MDDEELGNIFNEGDARYSSGGEGENGRKCDVIKENEDSSSEDDSGEEGTKKKKIALDKLKVKRRVEIFRFKPNMLTD